MAGGTLGGDLKLSRSAIEAALTGHLALSDAALATPAVSGRLDIALDLQGTGRSPAALVGSLTGGGTFALRQPRLGDLSETAFGTVVAAVDGGLQPLAAKVAPAFEHALIGEPMTTGDLSGSLSLAGGVLHLATATTRARTTGLSVAGSINLASLSAKAELMLAPSPPGDDLGGPVPGIAIIESGPLDALVRDVDVSSLTAWLTVRSAEREAAKLEVLEAERQLREQAEEEQRKAEAQRLQLLIEADKAAAAEKAAAEAAAAEKKAAAEAAAAEKKAAAEAAAAERKAAAEAAAAEKKAAADAAAAARKAAAEAARRPPVPMPPAPPTSPPLSLQPAPATPPAAVIPAVAIPDPAPATPIPPARSDTNRDGTATPTPDPPASPQADTPRDGGPVDPAPASDRQAVPPEPVGPGADTTLRPPSTVPEGPPQGLQ